MLFICYCHFQYVAEVLLKYGAAIDSELGATKNKLTPLMIACAGGHLEMVRLLVKHGANALKKGMI
jgi:ankyrin repeat protein